MKRRLAYVLCGVDLAIWVLVAILLLTAGSDPATSGLDTAALVAATILFALTAIPALLLTRAGRAPDLALAFALAFPAAFLLLLGFAAASLA